MSAFFKPSEQLQVSDLVLHPFAYREALHRAVHQGDLPDTMTERLAMVLPCAIAQLDAIGDPYGAMVLQRLYDDLKLARPVM